MDTVHFKSTLQRSTHHANGNTPARLKKNGKHIPFKLIFYKPAFKKKKSKTTLNKYNKYKKAKPKKVTKASIKPAKKKKK